MILAHKIVVMQKVVMKKLASNLDLTNVPTPRKIVMIIQFVLMIVATMDANIRLLIVMMIMLVPEILVIMLKDANTNQSNATLVLLA
jgi:hypothetical protein